MKIFTFEQVTSTQDLARNYLKQHLDKAVFVANSQTNGYGKQGRSFYAPANTGVYFSIAIPNFNLNPEKSELLTPAIATALVNTLNIFFPLITLQLKWVNDIYLNNKKVGGILTEFSSKGLIIGIGINISTQTFPQELQSKAGSITKHEFNRIELIRSLIDAANNAIITYDTGNFLPEYRRLSCTINKKVTLKIGKKEIHGLAKDINNQGKLVVKSNGKLHSYSSGEVIKVESK